MKKVAICQSNYIPWKGYFDLINSADEFYLLDCVNYTKNDWRNRNIIKTEQGLKWLTIPVLHKSLSQKISETLTSNNIWRIKHWKSIKQNYTKSKYFSEYQDLFQDLYLKSDEASLSKVNYSFIMTICSILGIRTKIILISEDRTSAKNLRLIDICKNADAQMYISGPTAKNYLDEGLFKEHGIDLRYMDYSGYPEYRQLYGTFEHGVSIIDLIFNEGEKAIQYMKSFAG